MSQIRYLKRIVVLTLIIGVCSLLGARAVQADPSKTSIEPLLNLMLAGSRHERIKACSERKEVVVLECRRTLIRQGRNPEGEK